MSDPVLETFQEQMNELSKVMSEGHIQFEELLGVARKMGYIRTTDKGFGKILIEMQRGQEKKGRELMGYQDVVRIRTYQDMVLKSLDCERLD